MPRGTAPRCFTSDPNAKLTACPSCWKVKLTEVEPPRQSGRASASAHRRAWVRKFKLAPEEKTRVLIGIPEDGVQGTLKAALAGPPPYTFSRRRNAPALDKDLVGKQLAVRFTTGYFRGEVTAFYNDHPRGYTHEVKYSKDEARDHNLGDDEYTFKGNSAKDGDDCGSWTVLIPK